MELLIMVEVMLQGATTTHSQSGCKIQICFPSFALTLSQWSRELQVYVGTANTVRITWYIFQQEMKPSNTEMHFRD